MSEHDRGLPQAPPRPPKDPMVLIAEPAPVSAARRKAKLSIMLGIAGVVTTLILPLGLALDVAAIVVGVRAWRRARAAGDGRRRDLAGVWLGGAGVALSGALVVMLAMLWTPFTEWSDCMSGANTAIAEHNCKEGLRADVRDKIGRDVPGLG